MIGLIVFRIQLLYLGYRFYLIGVLFVCSLLFIGLCPRGCSCWLAGKEALVVTTALIYGGQFLHTSCGPSG